MFGVLGATPGVTMAVAQFGRPVRISFVFFSGPGVGPGLTFNWDLLTENGAPVFKGRPQRTNPREPGEAAMFIFEGNLVFADPGRFTVRFLVEDKPHYVSTFTVERPD